MIKIKIKMREKGYQQKMEFVKDFGRQIFTREITHKDQQIDIIKLLMIIILQFN